MFYNNTELNEEPTLEEYEAKPTFNETLSASFKNFTSVNLSTSEADYYMEDVKKNIGEWKKTDAYEANQGIYKRVSMLSSDAIENYENLYQEGKIDLIASDKSEIGGLTGGNAFLKFKELEKAHGFQSLKSIKDGSLERAKSDYLTTLETLSKSDHTTAKILGTAGGVMTDPITLATLPLGTFMGGGSVAINALRAFGQEALIETAAQSVIAPKVYGFKKELGLKTSILEESIQAVASIVTAGTFRAFGSATYDLTSKGLAKLKEKDPELARDYNNLTVNTATENVDSHVQNMQKAEFGSGVEKVDAPNEKGIELNKEEPHTEIDDKLLKDTEIQEQLPSKNGKIEEPELSLTMKNEKGEPIQRSYKDLEEEIDTESTTMDNLFKCLRGGIDG